MGLRIKLIAFILSLFFRFSVFKAKFVSPFSQELCKLESSNMVYTYRMSYWIVGLRRGVMAFIFPFLSILFLSVYCMSTLKFVLQFSNEV